MKVIRHLFFYKMSEKYIIITSTMVKDLQLKGADLLIYGLINGFCQDGESDFHGSIGYITENTGLSRRSAISSLRSLVERKLVSKKSVISNGVTYNSYSVLGGSAKIAQGVQNLHGGGAKIAPNNKEYNKDIYKEKDRDINISKEREISPSDRKEKVAEKRKAFGESLRPFKDKYPRQMLVDFMNYWCEVDDDENPKYLKWELAKKKGGTWSLSGRLATWAKNNGAKLIAQAEDENLKKGKTPWEAAGISKEEYEHLK